MLRAPEGGYVNGYPLLLVCWFFLLPVVPDIYLDWISSFSFLPIEPTFLILPGEYYYLILLQWCHLPRASRSIWCFLACHLYKRGRGLVQALILVITQTLNINQMYPLLSVPSRFSHKGSFWSRCLFFLLSHSVWACVWVDYGWPCQMPSKSL